MTLTAISAYRNSNASSNITALTPLSQVLESVDGVAVGVGARTGPGTGAQCSPKPLLQLLEIAVVVVGAQSKPLESVFFLLP